MTGTEAAKQSLVSIVAFILDRHPDLSEVIKRLAIKAYPSIYRNSEAKRFNPLGARLIDLIGKKNGYFIELGANNGVTQSNTFLLERDHGWTGVLIEPVLHNFLACVQYRSSQTKKFCCACVSTTYQKDYVELVYSNLMTTPINLESDVSDALAHALEGQAFVDHPADTRFLAPARTLDSILQEADAPHQIDLLSLDVEGAELEVLKGINYESVIFNKICVESRDPERLEKFLSGFGYRLSAKLTHLDYMFEYCN